MQRYPKIQPKRLEPKNNMFARSRPGQPTEISPRDMMPLQNGCICQRPKSHVVCNVCGFQIISRVRFLCNVHPQTIFLMDLVQCPECRAPHSLREYPRG